MTTNIATTACYQYLIHIEAFSVANISLKQLDNVTLQIPNRTNNKLIKA
jgi:hypothetical protein